MTREHHCCCCEKEKRVAMAFAREWNRLEEQPKGKSVVNVFAWNPIVDPLTKRRFWMRRVAVTSETYVRSALICFWPIRDWKVVRVCPLSELETPCS